jgi:hypothetical protein
MTIGNENVDQINSRKRAVQKTENSDEKGTPKLTKKLIETNDESDSFEPDSFEVNFEALSPQNQFEEKSTVELPTIDS